MRKVNLHEKFGQFNDYWNPRIVGEINDAHIKLVKIKGEFTWHHHEREDELFLVVKGRLRMHLRDADVLLEESEFIIIPKGTEHCPASVGGEAHVLLMEPAGTLNTGNLVNERTVAQPERI
ncbi:MAG: cupin domain-containing protein [Gammaproteobacteria bacterium]|nr:cupin domain-containing protein [Gammaproteobacteria bacterium]